MGAVNAVAPTTKLSFFDTGWRQDRRFFIGMAVAAAVALEKVRAVKDSSGHTYRVRAIRRHDWHPRLESHSRSVVREKSSSNYKTREKGSKIHLFFKTVSLGCVWLSAELTNPSRAARFLSTDFSLPAEERPLAPPAFTDPPREK